MKNFLLGMMISALPLAASAITINVTPTNCGTLPGSTTDNGGTACGEMNNAIRTEVNSDVPEVDIDKYGDGVSNSTSFAMKGQGSDYSDNFSYFVFKPSIGLAAQGDVNKPEKAEGVGIGGALTVGLNLDLLPVDKLGSIEFKKMDLFVSFMSYNLDQDQDSTSFNGDINSFGVHARYRIVDGKDIAPGYLLEWGGVHLHTGFQFNKMSMKMTQSFKDQTVTSNGQTATFGNSSATFTLDSKATSIPVEVSTYLRMLYAFTLYGGLGFDYVMGSTDIDLSAGGTATTTQGYSATISASETGSGKPDATNFRSFLGLQVNVPFVRLFVHVNKGLGNDLVGANAGVKILY